MLELNAAQYSKVLFNFADLERLVWQMSNIPGAPQIIDKALIDNLLVSVSALAETVEAINARFTAVSLKKFIAYVKEADELYALILARKLSEIRQRFLDEAELTKLFVVSDSQAVLFDEARNFLGQDAQQIFPEAIFDADEAGKCLALARYTACVFHVMRAAEAVVAALAGKIGAAVKNQHNETLAWGILAANIGQAIQKKQKSQAQDDWHQAHMFLVSCNRAFRTKTAHPVQTYTQEQAREAYDATRAFIRSAVSLM